MPPTQIPPPVDAVLLTIMLLVMIGEDSVTTAIPPPTSEALLPVMVLLVMAGEER